MALTAHQLHMWNKFGISPAQEAAQKASQTTTSTPAQTQAQVAQTAANRDAQVVLSNLFQGYGLGSLVPQIVGFIQQGYSSDAITVLLSQTPEYKQRFAANDVRVKNGLPALSPAEYVATERSYRQVMSAAGLPTGFYDQTADFQSFLSNDVSPTELQSRVDRASEAINKAPAQTLDYFKQWYNSGDLVAYALDPERASTLVDKRLRAAEAAGVAQNNGVQLSQSTAEGIGAQGIGLDQVRQGFGFIGQEKQTTDKLDNIYGGNVTADDLVQETFFNSADATQKRQKLASQERAAFGGSAGAGANSLKSGSQF